MVRANRLLPVLVVLSAFSLLTAAFASTITIDQCPSCGPTGGAALQIVITGLNAPASVAVGLVNTSASYAPSSITSIDASVDKNSSFSQATPFTGTFASGFRPLVEQDGNIYILNPGTTGPIYGSNTLASTSFSSGWGTIQCDPTNSAGCPNSQTSLTLSNFQMYSFATGAFGSGTPNSTDPVYFGLATITSINNSQIVNGTGENDFANLNISDGPLLVDSSFNDLSNYQTFEFTSTPEPSTFLLLASGLAGLCCRVGRIRGRA